LNFWDLHYILYLLGFLLLPRVTVIVIFSSYVTNGFVFGNLFLPITVWWMFPKLALSLWNKIFFDLFMVAFPRLLLGIIGCIYLPNNRLFMICACVLGLFIDITVKTLRRYFEKKESA